MLQIKYCLNYQKAALIYAIPYVMNAFLSPLLGIFIDKHGKRMYIMIASIVLIIIAIFITMILPSSCPGSVSYSELGPIFLIGLGLATYGAALW